MDSKLSENILLVGFMGVGKSTIARTLAKKLDVVSVDTDSIIENMENKKIKKIFKNSGENYFRTLEQQVANWLEKSVTNTIVSVGGGFYAVTNLKKIGKIIYLNSSFEDILKRIKNHPNAKRKLAKRPLLASKKQAKILFDKREKEYIKCADIIIDMKKYQNEQDAVNDILHILTCKNIII